MRQLFYSLILASVAVSLPMQCLAANRQTVFNELPRPTSPGQVAQATFPSGEILSITAPSINIGETPEFDTSELSIVSATLAQKIRDKNFTPEKVTLLTGIQLNGVESLEKAFIEELSYKPLTPAILANVSQQIQALCEQEKHICLLSFEEATGKQLMVTITPTVIEEVSIEDGKHFKARSIRHQLGLKDNRLLNPHRLKAQVQQVMDNPDITVVSKLEPLTLDNPHSNRIKARLAIQDKLPYHLTGYWSNVDQFDYGEYVFGVGTIANNITGHGDTFGAFPVLDKYTSGVVMHYEVPINEHGTRFKADSSIIRVHPKTQTFVPYDFKGKGWTLGVGLSHPLIRRPNWRLTTDITTELQQVRTEANNTDAGPLEIEQENLRDIRIGLQWDHTGDYGSTMIRHEITQGLNILGATDNNADKLPVSKGGTEYTRYIGTLSHTRNLPHDMSFLFNAQGQYSPSNLPSFQQYGAGGTFTGRGYKEVYIPGDSAVFASTQLNFPAFGIPKSWNIPFTKLSIRDSLELLAFTDYCWSKLNTRHVDTDPTEHLLSMGVGARLQLSKYVTGRVDVGLPILRNPPFNQTPRVHFGLIIALF